MTAQTQTTAAWLFYRDGEIVPVTETEARHAFDHWQQLSCDRGMANLMIDQLWSEIDRLRESLRRGGAVGKEFPCD